MNGPSVSPRDSRTPVDALEGAGPAQSGPLAVAVINSPLHAWQVREACARWDVPPQDVWVVVFKQPSVNGETLERTLEEIGDWGRVVWLATPPSLRPGLPGLASLARRERHRADWQRQLVGVRGARLVMAALNRLTVNRQVAAWLRGEELIWLDDGTMTPTLVRKDAARGAGRSSERKGATSKARNAGARAAGKRNKPNCRARQVTSAPKSAKQQFRLLIKAFPGTVWLWRRMKSSFRRGRPRGNLTRALDSWLQRRRGLPPSTAPRIEVEPISFKWAYPRALTYFTVAEVWPLPPGRWEPNRLSWMRARVEAASSDSAELHFLGAPLVERDGVPFPDYIAWLRRVEVDLCDVRRMVYVPHPWESEEFLTRLAEELEIEVRSLGLPYEIVLASMERRPAVVASWFCSALEHLEVVGLPDLELVAYRIPVFKSMLSKQRKANKAAIFVAAEAFYRRHEKGSGIDVRSVPEWPSPFASKSRHDALPWSVPANHDAR